MTLPFDAPPAGPDPAHPYPAPYEEPWGRLAFDLRAALASTGLRLRELARRNRQGELSVPGFWPPSLAWLFWPFLLALFLALVLALVTAVGPALVRPSDSAGAPAQELVLAQPVQSQPVQQQPAQQQPDKQPVPPAPSPPEQAALPLAIDPLLALLAEDDPRGCIASARPYPGQGRLELELAPTFLALAGPLRQQQADQWLERSRELGYERLRLLDGSGALLAQAARVGSGMVLLGPASP
ncbi:hypothetical protein KQ300_01215 [Synechococcus sp. CS-1331]|uniref:hypothetical protein n=1 Tax=Synechococcus sp. CS-1331 TaxID=2847973 RepID=UPI00223B089B|nr:hypothetical protein [Synechococcus sp. CS-1331]MCT0226822.1 hypothetical protein [Synechococcus sp. CS-1331]